MVKKTGFFVILAFVLIFAGLNLFLFFNKTAPSYASISGMYIKEPPQFLAGLNLSMGIFILQWGILFVILLFTLLSYAKHKHEEGVKLNYAQIRKRKAKAVTDLDTLYNLLKERKCLNVQSISKVFKITKEKALDWAKILENHELVRIEYPAFSSPEVKINEKEEKEEEGEKEGAEKIPKKKEHEKNTEKVEKPIPPKKPKRKRKAKVPKHEGKR